MPVVDMDTPAIMLYIIPPLRHSIDLSILCCTLKLGLLLRLKSCTLEFVLTD
jgi:hypothetical protein